MVVPAPPQVEWSSTSSGVCSGSPALLHAYLMSLPEGSSARSWRKAATAPPILSCTISGMSVVATAARRGTGARAEAWRRRRAVRWSRRRMATRKAGKGSEAHGSTARAGATRRRASTTVRSDLETSTSRRRAFWPRGWRSASPSGMVLRPRMGWSRTSSVRTATRSGLKSLAELPMGCRTRSMGAESMGAMRGRREPSHE
mmetsp:Transcript_2451/g.6977  ORF Transcript_2451/g.6977 Transcript_2451/m.6977 type:complete len:201 (+) Transcript_2451:2103-2705(+)